MAFFLLFGAVLAVILLVMHALIAKKSHKFAAVFSALVFAGLLAGGLTENLFFIGLEKLKGLPLYLVTGAGLGLAIVEFILAFRDKRLRLLHKLFMIPKQKILPLIQLVESRLGKSLFGLLISLMATGLLLILTILTKPLEYQFLDLRNQLRYADQFFYKVDAKINIEKLQKAKSPDIAVIKMDSYTFASPAYGQMPWRRTSYTIPLDHFSRGQLVAELGWLNKPEGGTFRIYASQQPIKSAADLDRAALVRIVKGNPHQTFINHMLFTEGVYYFAVTEMLPDGKENRFVQYGKNSTTLPVSIRIKPALREDAIRWEQDFRKAILPLTGPQPEKTVDTTTGVDQLQVKKHYPKAFFYDVFFLDRKSTVFRTPKGEFFDPYAVHDYKLLDTFRKNDGIMIDYIVTHQPQAQHPDLASRLQKLDRFTLPITPGQDSTKMFTYLALEPPFPDLIAAVDGAGYARPGLDEDDKVRTFSLVCRVKSDPAERYHLSAVLLLAMRYFEVPRENVEIRIGEHILLKNARIPVRDGDGRIVAKKTEDIRIPIDRQGEMRINYVGKPETFLDYKGKESSFVSFTNYNPSTLDNRIFMIGLYEEAVSSEDRTTDFRKTPMGEMFGIEMMANALNTIVTRQFLEQIPPWLDILIVAVIGLLLGLLLPRISILKGAIIALVFLVGILVGGYFIYEANLIINMAMPVLNTVLVFMFLSVYKTLSEETEKKQIRNMFGKMANEEVVDEMLKHPDMLKLGGERRDMTVLFSDIRGFTSISESINNPEELVQLLNEYLNAMTLIVKENQGILDKYVGDEIMAFWGAPLLIDPREQAFLACRTAVRMIERLEELNQNWPVNKRLNIGIGINTGPMLVGYMGSESRMDYTVIGDAVNLGARLESANKQYKTRIIINMDTHALVHDRVHCRELDRVRVVGKDKPVTIYELVGIKEG